MRLKSSNCYRALGFNYSMSLLLAWEDRLVIRSSVLPGSELVLGMSCLGIFRPLLATVWVPAGLSYGADGVCTAWDLVYRAMGA
jgi:hypothetical protein